MRGYMAKTYNVSDEELERVIRGFLEKRPKARKDAVCNYVVGYYGAADFDDISAIWKKIRSEKK